MTVPRVSVPTSVGLLCLLLLALPCVGQAQEPPVPAQPNASTPPVPDPPIDWEGDPELRWLEVVPVFLWWAGEDEPRLQICTEDDVTGAEVGSCPIQGAPDTVKSLHMRCPDWKCDELTLRKRVKVFGKIVDGLLVAGRKGTDDQDGNE